MSPGQRQYGARVSVSEAAPWTCDFSREGVLFRFIVVMLAPAGVFQFRDWLR